MAKVRLDSQKFCASFFFAWWLNGARIRSCGRKASLTDEGKAEEKKAKGRMLETNGGGGDGNKGKKQAADVSDAAGCFKFSPYTYSLPLSPERWYSFRFLLLRTDHTVSFSSPLCFSLLSIVSTSYWPANRFIARGLLPGREIESVVGRATASRFAAFFPATNRACRC